MKVKVVIAALILLGANALMAQTDADKLEIVVGGSFAKPKIVPNISKLALAQLTVNYKLTTTAKTVGKEKSSGAMAGAELTAYLETTDGDLTESDFQEITDYFYKYFQKRLKENGIDTVAWSVISATEFYQNSRGTPDAKMAKGGNVWVTSTANKGNIIYGGAIPFAMGKIKKASRFSEEIGAPAGYFHVTVDFAEVLVNVGIKTSGGGYDNAFDGFALQKTRSFKYDASAKADMQVAPSGNMGMTLFWNEKDQGEAMVLRGELKSGAAYHDNISQDASRIKNKAFAFNKTMVPVVIETTREKYKAAAKKALEKFADAFIAKTKAPVDSKKK